MKKTTAKKRPTTISDVAAIVGVAPMTVSRVINQSGYVSEETRRKVLTVIKEMNYRRNGLARSLKRQRTDTIGLVLGDIANPYGTEIARAVRQTASAHGYNLFICISEHSPEEDMAAFQSLASHSVDGLIVATRANVAGDNYLAGLAENNVPIVVIGRDFHHSGIDYIAADNLLGGFEATQHLIDLGHQRIGFIGATIHQHTKLKRLQGYLTALEKHGLKVEERLVTGRKEALTGVPGYSTEEIGYEGMKRLLSLPQRPTAVFARNDFTAIGAMTAIKEARLAIPQDIAIIGFDDIPLALHTSPSLSTVRQPMRLQGQWAADLLLRRIEAQEAPEREERILNCELIVRESTVALRN